MKAYEVLYTVAHLEEQTKLNAVSKIGAEDYEWLVTLEYVEPCPDSDHYRITKKGSSRIALFKIFRFLFIGGATSIFLSMVMFLVDHFTPIHAMVITSPILVWVVVSIGSLFVWSMIHSEE